MVARFLCLLFLSALLSACASRAVQTEEVRHHFTGPRQYLIADVPYLEQTDGFCGPATLTMSLLWSGQNVSIDKVGQQLYTPGMKGTLQADMIGASRRQGMLAIPITGMDSLLKEVAAGNPVIVFENLALRWLPQWHYALVFGYDLDKQVVQMHSGPEQNKTWDMSKFERSWMLADYWGLVVLPPNRLSATAGENSHLTAASALEQLGKHEAASQAYAKIIERWPQSLGALIGQANISFAQSRFTDAADTLLRATRLHPQSAVAWHNLAIAQGKARQLSEAKISARKAVEWAAPKDREIYQSNLKDWL